MIIECSNCHARYQYDEARFEGKPSKKIKCAKCQSVFEVHNPSLAAGAAAAPLKPGAARAAPSGVAPGKAASPAGSPATPSEATTTRLAKTKRPKPPADTEEALDEQSNEARKADLMLPAGLRLSLAIIDGNNAGSVHRITKPRVTVGRSGADIVIDEPEASRQHVAIEIRDTLFLLSDLQSRNGTLVNGEKILEPVEIQDKSEFVIGGTTMMLIVTQDA